MLVRVAVICVFLTVALKSDNAFTRAKSWWLSTGSIPASYFGLTVDLIITIFVVTAGRSKHGPLNWASL